MSSSSLPSGIVALMGQHVFILNLLPSGIVALMGQHVFVLNLLPSGIVALMGQHVFVLITLWYCCSDGSTCLRSLLSSGIVALMGYCCSETTNLINFKALHAVGNAS